jgi:hypothetical protein
MRYITEEYSKGDAYLPGRKTYEMLWPGWPKQTTGDGPGPILNRMHKYVVSTTLKQAPWKESTIISENVVEEITKLKQPLPIAASSYRDLPDRATRSISIPAPWSPPAAVPASPPYQSPQISNHYDLRSSDMFDTNRTNNQRHSFVLFVKFVSNP